MIFTIFQQALVKFPKSTKQGLREIQLQLCDDMDEERSDSMVVAFASDGRREVRGAAEMVVTINQAFNELLRRQEFAIESKESFMKDEVYKVEETKN